ncbi:hypothetical protein SASPL_123718 [Salvia splendens]|uniref:Uncharacterized protein n=1 Tax=Salvia splendens TaxID=180675 RepID=A0A8X8ZTP4_SALSN|nr:uncharacterized protein LOC121744937 [Salvia splendens]KAG6416291.1 hypothetical protein SASPL_123718 [Salvia splendens]
MASISTSTHIIALHQTTHTNKNLPNHDGHCSFLRRSHFHTSQSSRPSNKDFVVRRATPEIAGEIMVSNPLSGIPFIGDNPLLAGIFALTVGVPFMIQRIVAFTKQIEAASQTVEKIADTVENIADEVDKAAEELKAALPDGRLKEAVTFVEKLAENTSDGADKVSDLMDMVQEFDDKLDEFMDKDKNKGTGKA